MSLTAPMRCSALAEHLDEPMIGTAEPRARWLLIEDHGAWGHDAVGDLLGPDRVAALKAAGIRPLLVRRREGDPAADAVRDVTLVDAELGVMGVRRVGSLDELDELPLPTMAVEEFGTPRDGPMFLVCTNGKRDACCALRGRALLGALAARHRAATWESTHLGGHRFAANLVCLPHGFVYGRVRADDGPRLADAYAAGAVDPELLRGRATWAAPAQVAEQHVRIRDGLTGVDEVALVSSEVDHRAAVVTLAVRGGTRAVRLRSERVAEPRPTSCRADELESPIHWIVESG